jgi:hypothetical protein
MNYEFDAYLKRDGHPDVLCNVMLWLPRDASEDMRILTFAPGIQDVNLIFFRGPLILKSTTNQEHPTFEVIASGVHLKEVYAKAMPQKMSGINIDFLYIAELTIESKYSANRTSVEPKNRETIECLYFQLSDLKYATPEAFVMHDYLGNRKVDIKKIYAVKFIEGFNGLFRLEKHYSSWHEDGQNKERTSSQRVLVWQGENPVTVDNIPMLLKLADDVALVLSFAARHRVMVLDYKYLTQHSSFQQFRSPLARHRIEREETGRDELIPITELEVFMQKAMVSLWNLKDNEKESIRLAIVALHPLSRRSSESDYLMMFAALEGLSKFHKDKVVSELEKTWKGVKDALCGCIDNQISISHDAKGFLKKNLSALRQGKKLEDRLKAFFKSRNVNIADLLPIFGTGDLPDLYWVRNELAHGQHFSDERFGAFLKAKEHLSLILERIVLCLLGFNPQRTTAGIQSLYDQGRRLSPDQLEELLMQLKRKKQWNTV